MSTEPFVVDQDVKFNQIRLIDENGKFHNNFSIKDALSKATGLNLDLVCFNEPESDNLAFCKIINFGKWKYESEKIKKKNNKKQSKETKMIRFSPVISAHDIEHKVKQVKTFIDEGCNVIINMDVNTKNNRQMVNADQKIIEVLEKCKEFSKEMSRNRSEYQISINLSKK